MKVLCVWEMGGGLGHLVRLAPFVEAFLQAGCEVAVAARQLERVQDIYKDLPIQLFGAPYFLDLLDRREAFSWPEYFLGFCSSSDRLSPLLSAWKSIYESVSPDLVIYDAAPTALIASFGEPWMKWVVGSPFFVPRTDLPVLGAFPSVSARSDQAGLDARLKRSEHKLWEMLSECFAALGMPPISSLSDILSQVDRELLTSIPEFDYFGARSTGEYLGVPASPDYGQTIPSWDDKSALKIFAYVKFGRSDGLARLLSGIEALGCTAVVYSPDAVPVETARFSAHCFVPAPVSMSQVCAEADLVIHMGGSQTVARCLAAGIPQLLFVPTLEQRFTAMAAENLGIVTTCFAFRKTYHEEIKAAVELASKGRFAPPKIDRDMLDGSYMKARIKQLVEDMVQSESRD